MKQNKLAILTILVTIVAMAAPASAVIGSQNIETKAERMVDIAYRAQETIIGVVAQVEGDATAYQMLLDANLDEIFYDNVLRCVEYNTLVNGENADADGDGWVFLAAAVQDYEDKEYEDLLFGWFVEQGVTSNSVLYVKDGATVGIGTGEQDRVGVAEIAVHKAYTKYADLICADRHGMSYKDFELLVEKGEKNRSDLTEIDNETKDACGGLKGASMVSDAFFPFRDGADVGIRQGITSIVQPGGSERDYESIIACNEADPKVAMVYTGQRSFKH